MSALPLALPAPYADPVMISHDVGFAPNELGIDGLVDEVAIWTRHLDEAEITTLYP